MLWGKLIYRYPKPSPFDGEGGPRKRWNGHKEGALYEVFSFVQCPVSLQISVFLPFPPKEQEGERCTEEVCGRRRHEYAVHAEDVRQEKQEAEQTDECVPDGEQGGGAPVAERGEER